MTQRDISDTLRKSFVLTNAQWRAAGVSATRLRSLTRSGDLVRVRFGVYATRSAVAWAADDPRRRHALQVMAAMRSAGRSVVGSHHSAAVVHGLDLLEPAPRDVVTLTGTMARTNNRPTARGIVFHVATVPASHVTRCLSVLVTTGARTVVDIARTSPFMEAVVVADSALRLGKSSKPELAKILELCGQWPGGARARRVIDFADERAESALESCARAVFHERGLEPAELQVTFRGDGFASRVDFYWSRYRTVAEADGMGKYEDPGRAREQLRRDRLLRDAGCKVVHFTWRELFDTPEMVVIRIRKAFAAPTAF